MMGPRECGTDIMCDKCVELDKNIENLQRMHSMADDKLALALVAEAIAALQAEKASLHPEEQK
jgi:hypothetical protein